MISVEMPIAMDQSTAREEPRCLRLAVARHRTEGFDDLAQVRDFKKPVRALAQLIHVGHLIIS